MPKRAGNRTTADWKEKKDHTVDDKMKRVKEKKKQGKELNAPIPKFMKGKLTSAGGISQIVMNPEDEEMMLKLITMLDSGELEINLASALPDIADTNCESTDDDDDDDDGDDNDDDDDGDDDGPDDDEDNSDSEAEGCSDDDNFLQGSKGLSAAATQPLKTDMIFTERHRRSLVRKLIRDDRKTSFDLACKARDDKVSRVQLARSMMISPKKNPQGDSSKDTPPSLLKNSGLLPLYLDETPVLPSSVVRVNISCSSKPGKVSQVVLVDRTETVEGLIEIARKKFMAPKKYSVLLILPEGATLRRESLFNLPNGSNLSLAIGSDKLQPSSDKAADAAPRPDKGRAALTPLKNNEESEKPEGSDNMTDAAKDDYWSPPETVVVQAQKTPRRLGEKAECSLLKRKQEAMFSDPSYREIKSHRQALPIHRVRKVMGKQILFTTSVMRTLFT
jgi:hypothetical protein